MKTLITEIDSLVTVATQGKPSKNGAEMQDIGEIRNGALLFDDKIEWVGKSDDADNILKIRGIENFRRLSGRGKTILPGFVDSHTHIVFAGNRSGEFARRLRGATYKEIAEEGGGILTTMKAVRKASVEELAVNGRNIAMNAIRHGTTAFEIKSGYGLTLDAEIKQLKAIQQLREELPIHISATFLGAHDFPPEFKNNRDDYVALVCNEMLPVVAEEKLAEFCDAFIDEGYYTTEQGRRILEAGLKAGLKLKVHCDELADVGATELAAELGAVSADHLLFVSESGIEALRKNNTIATLLPGTAYFIRLPYAPARKIINAGCAVALSTDCNPGSCFTENMQNILSLAVINMNMTAEEAISAATINGAAAIGKSDEMGSLEEGKYPNFIVLNSTSYTDMFYHFGINHITEVWVKGARIV